MRNLYRVLCSHDAGFIVDGIRDGFLEFDNNNVLWVDGYVLERTAINCCTTVNHMLRTVIGLAGIGSMSRVIVRYPDRVLSPAVTG